MRVLFTHDNKFYRYQDKYTSTGLNYGIFKRYLNVFESMIICGREIRVSTSNDLKGNVASGNKVNFANIINKNAIKIYYNKSDNYHIERLVKSSGFLIARLDSIIGFRAIYYAKKHGIPYAIELCTDPWDCYINYGWKGKILAPWITHLTKKEVKQASNVIYVTNDYLQQKYPCTNNTIAISNVECTPVQEVASKNKIKYSNRTSDQSLTLGTAGALLPFKGQRFVIEAMHLLDQQGFNYIHYRLAGNGNDIKILKRLVKKYNLENRVEFCGTLNSDEMKEFYDSLDIYIQPSLQEGLPRTVIEAMSRGLCCLGSRTAGIPELLPEKRIFNKKDYKAIAEMIKALSKEDMIGDSKRNFEESKKYDKEILEKRRTNYFTKIIRNP